MSDVEMEVGGLQSILSISKYTQDCIHTVHITVVNSFYGRIYSLMKKDS